jgi:hypothetical protein
VAENFRGGGGAAGPFGTFRSVNGPYLYKDNLMDKCLFMHWFGKSKKFQIWLNRPVLGFRIGLGSFLFSFNLYLLSCSQKSACAALFGITFLSFLSGSPIFLPEGLIGLIGLRALSRN